MTRSIGFTLLVALLATACQVGVTPAGEPRRPAAGAAPASSAPSPSAAASASAARKGAPPDRAQALAKLTKPAGGTTALGGRVTLDAGYMVAAGAGNILSHNGAQLVAAGGLNLIGADGATLVGMDGASLVAAGAGNAVAAVGADGPAALLAAGSGLVGPDGASVVGPNGGQVVGNNGGSYVLAQRADAVHATMPAAGMMVWVRSLIDGKPVPLGVDARGQTVWAVYTDAQGRFEVFLPEGLAENVVIEAEKPFAKDARLALRRLTDPSGDREVSEATTAVAGALRDSMTAKFSRILGQMDALEAQGKSDAEIVEVFFAASKSDPAATAVVAQLVTDLLAQVKAAGIPKADYPALALALGDRVLATGGALEGVAVEQRHFGVEYEQAAVARDPYYGKEALEALEGIFRDAIAKHDGRTADDLEAAYRDRPYVKLANAIAAREGRAPHAIRKGADFVGFVVREYLGLVQGQGYGCETASCPPNPPGCDFVATRLACIPLDGVGPLSSSQIRALMEAALVDAGLPASHAYMVNAASIALGTKFGIAAAARPDELACTIRTFKAGGGRCEAP